MFTISANSKYKFDIISEKGRLSVNGKDLSIDQESGQGQHIHVLHENKSYRAELVSFSAEDKTCIVKVNGNVYHLDIKDQYDELLHQLGMDNLNKTKVADLKAPMPGMVLSVLVSEGDEVKKGDNILILEAMKMENIIKAPADVTVKAIKVKASNKVEKNQVLILFA